MEQKSILVVEDDPAVASLLTDALEADGYRVRHAASGGQARGLLGEAGADLVVLDLNLPDANGLLLCAELKALAGAPVIICSGTKRADDLAIGLKLGADDFVRKPVQISELRARVERALGAPPRSTPEAGTAEGTEGRLRAVGGLVIEHARRRATVDGAPLQLTPTEYRLLTLLVERAEELVTGAELARAIWGQHDPAIGEALQVHVRRLRAKLAAHGEVAPSVVTVRGFGYLLRANAPSRYDACSPVAQ